MVDEVLAAQNIYLDIILMSVYVIWYHLQAIVVFNPCVNSQQLQQHKMFDHKTNAVMNYDFCISFQIAFMISNRICDYK